MSQYGYVAKVLFVADIVPSFDHINHAGCLTLLPVYTLEFYYLICKTKESTTFNDWVNYKIGVNCEYVSAFLDLTSSFSSHTQFTLY